MILSPITCCNRTDQTNIYQPTSRTNRRMPRSCELHLVTNNIHGHQHSTLAISTRAVTAFLPAWKGFGAVSPASAAPQLAFFGPGTQALAVTNATPSPSFWLAGWRVPSKGRGYPFWMGLRRNRRNQPILGIPCFETNSPPQSHQILRNVARAAPSPTCIPMDRSHPKRGRSSR